MHLDSDFDVELSGVCGWRFQVISAELRRWRRRVSGWRGNKGTSCCRWHLSLIQWTWLSRSCRIFPILALSSLLFDCLFEDTWDSLSLVVIVRFLCYNESPTHRLCLPLHIKRSLLFLSSSSPNILWSEQSSAPGGCWMHSLDCRADIYRELANVKYEIEIECWRF